MIYKNIWVVTNVTEAALRWIAVGGKELISVILCVFD